jgi:hypothetical protein
VLERLDRLRDAVIRVVASGRDVNDRVIHRRGVLDVWRSRKRTASRYEKE